MHQVLSVIVAFICHKNGNEAHKIKLDNVEYERVNRFCYLGDMFSPSSEAEASSITWVSTGWKKFRELLPLLTSRVFSHKMKGNIYKACVRSAMLYGRETWPVKRDNTCRLQRTEMQISRWMCSISLWSCSKCASGGLATQKGWIPTTGLVSGEAGDWGCCRKGKTTENMGSSCAEWFTTPSPQERICTRLQWMERCY